MAKVKEILSYTSLIVGIISGILAILEKLTNWGMLGLLYPLIGQGTLFWLLLVVALTFLTPYMIGARAESCGTIGIVSTSLLLSSFFFFHPFSLSFSCHRITFYLPYISNNFVDLL